MSFHSFTRFLLNLIYLVSTNGEMQLMIRGGAPAIIHRNTYNSVQKLMSIKVKSPLMCFHKCLALQNTCYSINIKKKRTLEMVSCELLPYIGCGDPKPLLDKNVDWEHFVLFSKYSLVKMSSSNKLPEIGLQTSGKYSSCQQALMKNENQIGWYNIKPLNGTTSVKVRCRCKEGKGITEIKHNFMPRTKIASGIEINYGYSINFTYEVDDSVLTAVVKYSVKCWQYYSIKCHHVALKMYASWISHSNKEFFYFGGAHEQKKGCDCGKNSNCDDPVELCNCDLNDEVVREDKGYFVIKDDLPIKQMKFGDMGREDEYMWLTVGQLECEF